MDTAGDKSVFQTTAMTSGFMSPQSASARKGPFVPSITDVTNRGAEEVAPRLGRGGSPNSIANSTWTKQYHGSGLLYPKDKDKDGFTSAFTQKQKLTEGKDKFEGISRPPQANYQTDEQV